MESDAAELHRTQPSGDKRQKAGRMGKGEGEKERRGKRGKREKREKREKEEKGKKGRRRKGEKERKRESLAQDYWTRLWFSFGYGLASAMV